MGHSPGTASSLSTRPSALSIASSKTNSMNRRCARLFFNKRLLSCSRSSGVSSPSMNRHVSSPVFRSFFIRVIVGRALNLNKNLQKSFRRLLWSTQMPWLWFGAAARMSDFLGATVEWYTLRRPRRYRHAAPTASPGLSWRCPNSSPQVVAAVPQPAPNYVEVAPVYPQPSPVYVYPPSYDYYGPSPYYWGYPAVSFSFGWGGRYGWGHYGGGIHGGHR